MTSERIGFDIWLCFSLFVLLIFGIWIMSSVSVFNSYTKEVEKKSFEFCEQNFPENPNCIKKEGREYAELWCEENNCNSRYLTSQVKNIFVGFGAMILAFFIPLSWWRRFSFLFYGFAFILLIFVLIKPLEGGFTSKSWISIPFFGSFQPMEFMKLSLIFYFSLWMEKKEQEVRTLENGFIPFVVLIALTTIPVMLQPDFGGTFILISIAVSVFFVAGGRIAHLFLAGGLGILLILLASIVFGYIRERLATFFDPSKVTEAARHQIEQSYLSIGNGGLFGAGDSTQSFGFLPEIQGDMIFSAVAEQVGFIGLLFVLGLYFFITYRGICIARVQKDRFLMLVATGIVAWFVSQSLVNMFVVTGIFPLTGITLPFLSYGGSSIMMSMISMGILLKISSASYEENSLRGRGNGRTPVSRYSIGE